MSHHVDRAALLMQQGRLDHAIEELGRALIDDPVDASTHGMMSMCLCDLDRLDEAERAAAEAIRHDPGVDIGHYAMAAVLVRRNRFEEARQAAAEAIRIDPEDADNYGLMARVLLAQERWDHARQAAEAGLTRDPEHVRCLNLRAIALQQLGRAGDALTVLEAALARDPENATTHTTAGWAALRDGDARKALGHFKEALRLDPSLDHARAGIVEALKARNVLYAGMLKYFFWMGRLSPRGRWTAIIGGYVIYRVLRGIANTNPDLRPWIFPFLAVYVVFVLLTWMAGPLSNLVLRLHPLGRLALSAEERVASNWLGLVLGIAAAACAFALVTGQPAAWLVAVGAVGFSIPLSATFACEPGWPRRVASLYTIALACTGLAAVALLVLGFPDSRVPAILGGVFAVGVVASSWLANLVVNVRPRR